MDMAQYDQSNSRFGIRDALTLVSLQWLLFYIYTTTKILVWINLHFSFADIDNSGQSYKHFMLINYDSRGVPDWKIPHITTLES